MDCSICLSNHTHEESLTLTCNHTFGKECIYQWCSYKKTCPLCRAVIKTKPIVKPRIVVNNRIYDDNGNLINRRQNYLDLYLDEGRVEYQDLLRGIV